MKTYFDRKKIRIKYGSNSVQLFKYGMEVDERSLLKHNVKTKREKVKILYVNLHKIANVPYSKKCMYEGQFAKLSLQSKIGFRRLG